MGQDTVFFDRVYRGYNWIILAIVSVVHDKKIFGGITSEFGVFFNICDILFICVDESSYNILHGKFKESYRDSRVAPPLPVTRAYVFDIGEKTNKVVYLDAFTKNKYFQENMVIDDEYTIYYEKRTK